MSKTIEHLTLETFVLRVTEFLEAIDHEMNQPSTPERGKKIAALCNQLEMIKDTIRFNVLGIDFRTGKPRKKVSP